jgi:tetratricopeptide (TPR) repeat protein
MTMAKKLLYVFYQDISDASTIQEYVDAVEQLHELIEINHTNELAPGISNAIYINENRIHIRPDWLDERPAIVFPSEIPFNKHCFLGTVFGLLGNEEKYREHLTGLSPLVFLFDLMQAIVKGEEADKALEAILRRTKFAHPFENYAFNHNVAIALNYGHFSNQINAEAIEAHYKDALQLAFEPVYKALTLKYYATFLIDTGDSAAAIRLIEDHPFKTLNEYAKYNLEKVWCQAAIRQMDSSDDESLLPRLKERLWDTLQFFDKNGNKNIAALLWMEAARIANMSSSHSEALGYINKAISYFKEESQAEMTAEAQLSRGRMLFEWAQAGQPQFYRNALESYQEALKIFTKEDTPDVFAEIHHQLGIIYAELPDENKKRSIWAALSATSFSEALDFFNKIDHPFEYGMICSNFANAYGQYPQGGRTDNFAKAIGLYLESLSVRPADTYPGARAVTLLNYLDASWKAGNPDEEFNTARYDDMLMKAIEIKSLTDDEDLIMQADEHLELLHELRKEAEVTN